MEQRINFHPEQEVPSEEMDALQVYAQGALDRTIQHLLIRSVYYKGLTVTKSGPTELGIAAGRYFNQGRTYVAAAQSVNVTAYLPAGANKRVLAIVATGEEASTATAPRQFLKDAETMATVTRLVSTRIERNAVVSIIAGTESLAPANPVVPIHNALLAFVTLSSTGIVDLPEQVSDQVAPNLEDVVSELAITNGKLARAFSLIDTLRNDLAGLARQIKGLATKADLRAVLLRLIDAEGDIRRHELAMRDIREAAGVPDRNSWFEMDDFEDEAESDTAHPAYSARIEGGALCLPDPSVTHPVIQLLNPLDPKVRIAANGLVLPDYTEEIRINLAVKEQEVSIATYPVVSHTLKTKSAGWMFKWHKTRWGGLVEKTLKKTGGLVELVDPESGTKVTVNLNNYTWRKAGDFGPGLWIYIEDFQPYWLEKTTTTIIAGATVAQTFLNSQSGWLVGIDLLLKAKGAAGDVHLFVCECFEDGTPNREAVLERTTVAYADLAVGWVPFDISPAHLSRGERYAVGVKTHGDHKFWGSNTNDLVNGTLFYNLDGVYWEGALNRDLSFRARFAKFKQTRVEVNLQPASRAGGISEIDFTLTGVRPASADFDIQAQIEATWRNIDNANANVFAAEPNLVPLRAVWTNTQHDAVGWYVGKSRLAVSKPDNTGVHVTTARSVPAGETTKRLMFTHLVENYDPAHHTLAVKMYHGAGYGTLKVADKTRITARRDGRHNLQTEFVFGAGINDYKLRTEYATDSAAFPVSFLQRTGEAESSA